MTEKSPPLPRAERIAAIDALRGFALIGILFYNVFGMGGPLDASTPSAPPSIRHPDWQVWWASELFVHGAMRGLFSMLFGASTLLFLRAGGRDAAFLRRCAWLFVFGVVNSTLLLWPGDILIIYALAGPIVLLFSRATPRQQAAAGGALIAVLAIWPLLVTGDAPADAANASAQATAAAAAAAEHTARLGSYLQSLAFMTRISLDWGLSLSTIWWVLDAAAFMLIGMASFNGQLLQGSAPRRTYWALALVGFGLGLPLRTWETWLAFAHGSESRALARMTFEFSRLLLTLGWVGCFMLLWNARPPAAAGGLARWLGALGRVALSGYLAQSIVGAAVFFGFGLGLWNRLSWPGMWGVAAATMLALGLLSQAWLRRFRMGPAEWLWRGLVFGSFPEMRYGAPR